MQISAPADFERSEKTNKETIIRILHRYRHKRLSNGITMTQMQK